MAGREAQQARGARAREAGTSAGTWRRVVAHGVPAYEPGTSADACDAVSGCSWLGFARDWPFCLPMPFLWLLNEQNIDIRELQVLWA